MDLVVRPLRAGDAEQVRHLEADARRHLVDQRGGLAHLAERPAIGDWLGALDAPDRSVWVATIDDVVVGYLELQLHANGIAEVLQVYIDPAARELGGGEGLLAAATDHARARGCTTLEGSALPGDRATKNLYERAGITARRIIVSRRLDDDV